MLLSGTLYGLLTAVTFGLIPFFTLPLLQDGYSVSTLLFYRFSISAIVVGAGLLWKKRPLIFGRSDTLKLVALGFVYIMSGVPFFSALTYMDSGVVSTIQFSYPVMVVLIMVFFFKEKPTIAVFGAAFMAFAGVAVFSMHGSAGSASALGVGLTLLSAVLTAIYVVGVQVVPLQSARGQAVIFYFFACGTVYSLIYATFDGSFELPRNMQDAWDILVQALITSALSNVALVAAVQRIGSSMAAILGSVEPIVAVAVGNLVFNESFTWHVGLGASMIVSAVVIVLVPPFLQRQKRRTC